MKLNYVDTGRVVSWRGESSSNATNEIALKTLSNVNIPHAIDRFSLSEARSKLLIEGWIIPEEEHAPTLILANGSRSFAWSMEGLARPDVSAALSNEAAKNSGFFARVDLSQVPNGDFKVLIAQPQPAKISGIGRLFSGTQKNGADRSLARIRKVPTVAALDEEIADLREAADRSFDEWLTSRAGFAFDENVSALPTDPLSPEYREAQMALYASISGQVGYNPWLVEPIPLDLESNVDPYFFPFNTKNPDLIGSHMVAVGHILKALSPGPSTGKTLLEYGCGSGFTSIFLATAGYQVTAVDINAAALKILDHLSDRRGLNVRTHNGVFGDIPVQGEQFDHILFYEAFHHCIDFADLLQTMHEQIKPGGSVIFAGEPVFTDFPKPWGLRLDGASLWEIRTKGWLELGFREDFFEEVLNKTGWTMQKISYDGFPPMFVARKT